MGAEKFFDIKCRTSGLAPDAAVVVATIRALKMHGGVGRIVAGKPLDPALLENNPDAVRTGGANLAKQIENVRVVRRPGGRRDQRLPHRHGGRRSRRSARSPSRPGRGTPSSPATSPTAARGPRTWRPRSGRPPPAASADFRLLYPDDMPLKRQDRDDRDADLRRRRRRLPARGGQGQLAQYEDDGLRPPADLHGEDAVQPLARRQAPRPADRLPGADPRGPARRGRGVHHADRRATCARCRASTPGPAGSGSTSTRTGTSSACSRRARVRAGRGPHPGLCSRGDPPGRRRAARARSSSCARC